MYECALQRCAWAPGYTPRAAAAEDQLHVLDDNAPGFRETQLGRQLQKIDYTFLAVFSAEAIFKIIAMGLLMAPNTYLRNGIGYISLGGFAKVTALRALRSLRPLRTISRIREMKNILLALIASIPAMGDVMLLMFIYFSMFGVMGVLLIGGGLKSRCAYPEFRNATTDASGTVQGVRYIVPEANGDTICCSPSTDLITWYNKTDPTTGLTMLVPQGVEAADRWSYHCDTVPSEVYPFGQFCTPFRNPGAGDLPADVPGYIGFDNILQAWIAVLQHGPGAGRLPCTHAVANVRSPCQSSARVSQQIYF
ncbi:Ion transport protein-domain-containing protein [Dunaliella salina]|uniref:Ion transport protein-domain-containing protein n=1 Tax=Dunaliella salina TaxID=3046 RepID=A0ABQ7GAC9_DUNSA|nr:Ion transport protein-domain-containing protein [Dunaliella salina]|eukprot:KAF5831556.1 Ion transport protein-domain-containing protein [Dunaliella salina]